MSGTAELHRIARAAGLHPQWVDVAGTAREVPEAVLRRVLQALQAEPDAPPVAMQALRTAQCGQALALGGRAARAVWVDESGHAAEVRADAQGRWPAPVVPGYYRWQQGARSIAVAVAPARAWWPQEVVHGWGVAVQVYSLRSEGDAGIGDSAGCQPWLARMQRQGGCALGLSPLHAGLPPGPGYSPYSPSDRRWLDPLQASLRQVLPEAAQAVLADDPALAARIAEAGAAHLIDWPGAAALKWRWLQQARQWLQAHQPGRWAEVQWWQQQAGSALQQYCTQAAAQGAAPADDHAFGQWLASRAWREVHQQARRAGQAIGLVADLAVGCASEGSEARLLGSTLLQGLELGAPPDAFNPNGQAWGITHYSPLALRQQGFAPFIALLRAVMRDRGGLRIDHILGLKRLWVLPRGAGAGAGVYLDYPFEDLLNLAVLESWRQQCVLIGEDLGVVPPGIRQTLAARGVLGIDVVPFSRDGAAFLPPAQWRRTAVAMPSTHDLPPLAGWLRGRDLRWRARLGELDDRAAALQARATDAAALQTLADTQGLADMPLAQAGLELVAAAPAPLALYPAEDLLGSGAQVNLPGTVGGHPNWRRRLPAHVDEPAVAQRIDAIAAARRTVEHAA